jgi:Zn-dependent protease with chaperone function
VLALETDSAWAVILAVSAVTLVAAVVLHRLIARPGGLASAALLATPLVLPLAAAAAYERALLPELAVLRPAGEVMLERSRDLLHLFLLPDPTNHSVTPYALTGSAGPWLLLFGLAVSSFMLVRRLVGMALVARLLARCRPVGHDLAHVQVRLDALARSAGLVRRPLALVLPPGVHGAFAVGVRRPRVLLSRDLLALLEPDELDAVLAHELAHFEARDVQIMFVGGLLRDLVAWNPFAHSALRRLAASREVEADRRAADLTGRPLALASGLVKVCELVAGRPGAHQRAALALLRPGGRITRRVTGLLALADGRTESRPAVLPYALAALIVALLGMQAGAQLAGQRSAAFAIVWGTPDGADMWQPKDAARARGHAVTGARAKAEVDHRPRYPDFARGLAIRAEDVPHWIKRMSRWAKRAGARGLSPATVRWESRQNWEAITLAPRWGPLQLYRLELRAG